MTIEEAARVLAAEAGVDETRRATASAAAAHDPKTADFLYRCAAKRLRPGSPGGGNAAAWDRVQKAVGILRHHAGKGTA